MGIYNYPQSQVLDLYSLLKEYSLLREYSLLKEYSLLREYSLLKEFPHPLRLGTGVGEFPWEYITIHSLKY